MAQCARPPATSNSTDLTFFPILILVRVVIVVVIVIIVTGGVWQFLSKILGNHCRNDVERFSFCNTWEHPSGKEGGLPMIMTTISKSMCKKISHLKTCFVKEEELICTSSLSQISSVKMKMNACVTYFVTCFYRQQYFHYGSTKTWLWNAAFSNQPRTPRTLLMLILWYLPKTFTLLLILT